MTRWTSRYPRHYRERARDLSRGIGCSSAAEFAIAAVAIGFAIAMLWK